MTEEPPDLTPVVDLGDRRTAREQAHAATHVKEGLDAASASLASAMDSVMNDKFVAFVQLAESILPAHSVLKEAWFNANVTSLVGVYLGLVPPDKVREFFVAMIDWMADAQVQAGGPPTYPPVVCPTCAPGGKGHG